MFSFLFLSLAQNIEALLPCSNQTVTLGKVTNKNDHPSWILPSGSYATNQNCLYQINVPKYYSAEVTVEFSGFIQPSFFSVSDTYGGIISSIDCGDNCSFSLEFPYPSVSITISIGEVADPAEMPTIGNLLIRSIEHKPFAQEIMFPLAAPSDASFRLIPVGPAIEPSVIFLGDCTNDTSLMFKSDNDPNITLHTLFYSSFKTRMHLINIHIYTYDDINLNNFYVVGTLFSPQILSELRKQAICLFISKAVQQEVFLMVTSDQNTNYYSNWELSYSLSPDRPAYLGPEFCMDATDGPAAYTVYSNLSIFDRFHKAEFLTNLIVTSINSTSEPFPPIKLYTTFPRYLILMQPAYTFTGDPNQLPQKTFSNVKTFVIESGVVCITTNFNAIQARWNIAYPNRKGFNIAQTPVGKANLNSKEFHFFSEDGVTNHRWHLNLNLPKSALDGSRCDIQYTYNNQTTSTQLLLNYSDPTALRSLVFDAERVDAVLRPVAGAVWVDFLIEETSYSSHLRHLLAFILVLLQCS